MSPVEDSLDFEQTRLALGPQFLYQLNQVNGLILKLCWDFPGSPGVKTHASAAGCMGSVLHWGTRIPTSLTVWLQKNKNKVVFELSFP